ncbi:MAG: insulinase family protein [Patescibacteria group bacterium]|nr:insulinase family protein [Patescibacteria group bacterium]MDE1945811.1 insulinase family protein [Patescibacteria group bacterium]
MQYTKKILKNGMRIITVPMKSNPTVTVLVLVEAGSKYETKDQNGISHFLEHMCFKGTKKRPTSAIIANELENIGSVHNAFTGHEYTGYYAKGDYKNAGTLLDVVADIYLNPIFPEAEIEKEKGVIVEEINMYADNPRSIAGEEFFKLLYGDTPAGWPIAGTKENVRRMTRRDFIDYRMRHYVAPATTVIVAGRIDERDIAKQAALLFKDAGTWKKEGKRKVAESQSAPQARVFYKDTDQAHIIVGNRSFDAYSRYNPAIRVLDGVLSGMSGRLFQKMREELGICYYVTPGNDAFTDHGIFAVSAGLDPARIKEGVAAILAELKRLTVEPVGKEELEKAKRYLVGTMYLGLESSDAVANFYGGQEIIHEKIKTPEDIAREVKAVTAEEVRAVAAKIFKNETLNLAVVGRFKDAKEFSDVLKY